MVAPGIARSVDELVHQHVRPGTHLHFSATMSRPNALLHAVARAYRGTRSLVVSTPAVHSSAHALALSGAVRRMITCFLGETYPSPRPCPLYRHVTEGEPFELESWSLLTQTQRLVAAALGQPAAMTTSLLGTDLAHGKDADLLPVDSPWATKPAAMMRPLRPDLTLVHGVCADRRGNIVLSAPYGEGPWAALAATRGVIASVERIVDNDVLDQYPQHVVIPGQRVIGVCEAPFGAHPQSLRTNGFAGIAGYGDDYEFITDTARACSEWDSAEQWFREWIDLPHEDYLAKLGATRLDALTGSKPPSTGSTPPCSAPPSRTETLIVLAARAVTRDIRTHGYDTVLAGIGASHLAAWLAAAWSREQGHEVKLLAELGFYGMHPEPGDVFLFSQQHADRSEQLCGITDVLGGLVSANPRCLGVLSAAEIDPSGAINTSRTSEGTWITGSGGAHDIAASTDCVVVAASGKHRYVPRVAAITSPGERVRTVVNEFGIARRDTAEDPFRLTSYLPDDPRFSTPANFVAERTHWPLDTASADPVTPISPDELALLRTLDPHGHFR